MCACVLYKIIASLVSLASTSTANSATYLARLACLRAVIACTLASDTSKKRNENLTCFFLSYKVLRGDDVG